MNKNNRNSKRKVILALAVAVLAILLFWLLLKFVFDRTELGDQFGDTGEFGEDEGPIELMFGDTSYVTEDNLDTYLLMGTDPGRENVDEKHQGKLADFLALLIVDNTTQKFGIIQIDRNTMMEMPDLAGFDDNGEPFKQQLCLARWYGENEGQRNDNVVMYVSELFGYLDVDNYYVLNMADMDKVNNAIGGVVVDIDTDMTSIDPEFVAGTSVHLTDDQSEKFLTARMTVGEGTNKERMNRQTQYMQKAYNMVMDQLRENPEYVNDLYDSLSDIIESEEKGSDVSRMANHLVQYESVGILQIDGTTKLNDTQEDEVEHEEFYPDQQSIISTLQKIIDLKKAE